MQAGHRRFRGDLFAAGRSPHGRLTNALLAVDELVTEAAAITEKVAVNLAVIPVHDAAKHSVSFAGADVAPKAAVNADRGRHLQIPLSRVVTFQRGVREYACGTNLDQIAGKLVFQHPVPFTTEKHDVAQRKSIQVAATGVFPIEPDASVALDATIHFVI